MSELVRFSASAVVLLLCYYLRGISGTSIRPEPSFVGSSLKNITVPEGRDVVLSCTVKNLDGHKVAWIHYDRSAILTVDKTVITRNQRIGVSHEGHHTWNLHIRDVQRTDAGAYMCQINTAKAKTRMGHLTVVVPPKIEDSQSSSDKVRTEGSDVTLQCHATGSPKPTVTWKRENGTPINIDKANNISVVHVEGTSLLLYKVSRLDMGAYMCIATNGVPPTISKRIQLNVDFPPMMWVPAQQMNVYYGQDATLVCVVEAHPDALVYWEFNGQIVQENQGYHIKILKGPPSPKYKTVMKMYIPRVLRHHFGTYACKAKNPRGDTDGIITLSERPSLTSQPPPTTTTVTITTTKTTRDWKKGDMYGSSLNEFNDLQSQKKRKQIEYHYETTSRYDMDHLYAPHGNNSNQEKASLIFTFFAVILTSKLIS